MEPPDRARTERKRRGYSRGGARGDERTGRNGGAERRGVLQGFLRYLNELPLLVGALLMNPETRTATSRGAEMVNGEGSRQKGGGSW